MTSELLVRPLPNSSTIDPGVKSTVKAISLRDVAS